MSIPLLTCCLAITLVPPAPPAGSPSPAPQYEGSGHINPPITDPMTRDELRAMTDVLALSAAQQATFDELLVPYEARIERFRATEFAAIMGRSRRLVGQPHLTDPAAARTISEWTDDCRAAERTLERWVDELFASFRDILTDDQWRSLGRVRSARTRHVSASDARDFPAANVDLFARLVNACTEQLALGVLDEPAVAEILDQYDAESVRLSRLRRDARARRHSAFYIVMADAFVRYDADPGAIESIRADRARQLAVTVRPHLAVLTQLRTLNDDTLARLLPHLPAEIARHVTDHVRRQAYPYTYPNPYDLRALFADVRTLTVDDAAVTEIESTWRSATAVIHSDMEACDAEWHLDFVRTRALQRSDHPTFAARMRAWDGARMNASTEALTALRVVIDPADHAQFDAWRAAHDERVTRECARRDRRSHHGMPWPSEHLRGG